MPNSIRKQTIPYSFHQLAISIFNKPLLHTQTNSFRFTYNNLIQRIVVNPSLHKIKPLVSEDVILNWGL